MLIGHEALVMHALEERGQHKRQLRVILFLSLRNFTLSPARYLVPKKLQEVLDAASH